MAFNTEFAEDVRQGLSSEPKYLHSKYFYDAVGDILFQQIMTLKEYYLTDCEYQILEKQKQDILIRDVMMPDLSGLEVLRFIRRDPRLEQIPVIVVSAKSLPSDIKDGLDAGANVYLTKPVAFQDLNAAVRQVIESAPNNVA